MVTATKAAFELHMPNKPLVGLRSSKALVFIDSRWLLWGLEEEVVGALQAPPGLLMPCYAVPPATICVVEVPREDEGLRM